MRKYKEKCQQILQKKKQGFSDYFFYGETQRGVKRSTI